MNDTITCDGCGQSVALDVYGRFDKHTIPSPAGPLLQCKSAGLYPMGTKPQSVHAIPVPVESDKSKH
jgi:hypothetical protein